MKTALYAGKTEDPGVLAMSSDNPSGAVNQQATTGQPGEEPQRLNERPPQGVMIQSDPCSDVRRLAEMTSPR